MKTIFLIGNDVEKIENRSLFLTHQAKEKKYKIIKISDSLKFIEAIRDADLFSTKKLIIVNKLSDLNTSDLNQINQMRDNTDTVIILKNENPPPATKLKYFGSDIKIENYNLPKVIWNLLDSFKKNNANQFFDLLEKSLQTEPIELIFYLLNQRIISLYFAKTNPSKLNIASWQVTKFQNQAENFEAGDLKHIIGELAEIDIKSKTGVSDMRTLIDLFIATKLE